MEKINKNLTLLFLCLLILAMTGFIFAGSITPPDETPTPTGYTLEDIYNLIHENEAATEGNHLLGPESEPTAPSSYSLAQIYADLANLIPREDVKTGTTYLGTTGFFNHSDLDREEVEFVASSLSPTTDSPEETSYTLDFIYNLITLNNFSSPDDHLFTPSSEPAPSFHSISDIYEALSTLIDPAKVRVGVIYLGIEGTYVIPVFTFNNDDSSSGTVEGDAIFNDAANNGGTINGDVTFNDNSFNDGIVVGDATFNGDGANGYGSVGEEATFNDNSVNHLGTVNNAIFNDNSYNVATITGDVEMNTTHVPANDGGTIDGEVTCPGVRTWDGSNCLPL